MGYKGTSKYHGQFSEGQKIGKWTVIDNTVTIEREAKLLCRCDCGRERKVSIYTIVKGTSTSCKICQNENYSSMKNPNWKGIGHIPGSKINKKWTPEFTQYLSDMLEQQKFKCALTNLPISFDDKTASPDRIDSKKGYIVGNVHWVHKDVNVMKNGYELDYFLKMCYIISKNNVEPQELLETQFVFGR
jgi:hypothetical protein